MLWAVGAIVRAVRLASGRVGSRAYDVVMGTVLRSTTRVHRVLHAASRGRLGRRFPGGAPVVWLTVAGRRSGRPRTVPLLAARDGVGPDAPWVVAGSHAGQEALPAWVGNLRAARTASVLADRTTRAVTVEEVRDGDERDRCYALLVGIWRGYAGYLRVLHREVPVFRLNPAPRVAGGGALRTP